jgi:hypothetical protein
MKHLAPGIAVFDNVFINSMDYINKLEESNLVWKDLWNPAEVLVDETNNKSETNYKARDTDLISLPHDSESGNGLLADFSKEFHKETKTKLEEYISFYSAKIQKLENPQLLRYGKEQKFHNHVDDHPLFTRRISMTYYLNDNYEGGEVEFKRHGLRFKAEKNQLLIFPSNFVFNHEVHPVTDGLRYVIVQWMA